MLAQGHAVCFLEEEPERDRMPLIDHDQCNKGRSSISGADLLAELQNLLGQDL